MAARVTDSEVRKVAGEPTTSDPTLAIRTANNLVEVHFASVSTLSDDTLRDIELYLAAHFLSLSSRGGPLAAHTLGDATERYHNIYAAGLKSTVFGQQAILLDTTGTLAKVADQAENTSRKTAEFQVV
jgi:hypothetical protein